MDTLFQSKVINFLILVVQRSIKLEQATTRLVGLFSQVQEHFNFSDTELKEACKTALVSLIQVLFACVWLVEPSSHACLRVFYAEVEESFLMEGTRMSVTVELTNITRVNRVNTLTYQDVFLVKTKSPPIFGLVYTQDKC